MSTARGSAAQTACRLQPARRTVRSGTFTGDLLPRSGLDNIFADCGQRYPRLELDDIVAAPPAVVLLPDEPYQFTADDGPEAFAGCRTSLVSGRSLTWYGPSLVGARAEIDAALARASPPITHGAG